MSWFTAEQNLLLLLPPDLIRDLYLPLILTTYGNNYFKCFSFSAPCPYSLCQVRGKRQTQELGVKLGPHVERASPLTDRAGQTTGPVHMLF